MTVTTARFAELLRDAAAWDERYKAMRHAQEGWLIENFVFGDTICSYATPIDRQKWDVPRLAGKYLFTRCG